MGWNTEDLIKLAAEVEDKVDRSNTHPERFFKDFGVVENLEHRVDADLIYYWYLQWCKEYKETDIIWRKRFFRKENGFPQWVKKSSFSGCMKYKLDKKSFPDSKEIREEIRMIWQKEKDQRDRKRNSRGSRKAYSRA